MPDQPEVTQPRPPVPTADEGLRCPECGYNLTGLVEEYCPECGQPHDRAVLRQALVSGPRPIPGWNDGKRNLLHAFVHTCLMTWFRPGHFGQQFPDRYDRWSAMSFRTLAFGVALGIFFLEAAILQKSGDLFACDIALPGIILGPLIYEALLAVGFAMVLVKPCDYRRPDLGVSTSWRGFIGFFRSFLIVSAATAGAAGILAADSASTNGMVLLFWALAVLAVLWWWLCLGLAVNAAYDDAFLVIIAVIFVPIAAVASIFLAAWASVFIALAMLGG